MVRSMTGYGAATLTCDFGEFAVEIRSVNNRFLDIAVRLPRELNALETFIRDIIKPAVVRGKCDVNIRRAAPENDTQPATLNLALLREYHTALTREFGAAFADAAAGSLMRLPGVIESDEPTAGGFTDEQTAALKLSLTEVVGAALAQFNDSRQAEGERLAQDLLARIEKLDELAQALSQERERVFADFGQRLREKAADFAARHGVEFDSNRLEMELVMFADRCDICEELVRLRSHFVAFRTHIATAKSDAPVGKSLDFLIQELLREATTAANKCRSSEASALCVEIKTEIEKIREQVQNIA